MLGRPPATLCTANCESGGGGDALYGSCCRRPWLTEIVGSPERTCSEFLRSGRADRRADLVEDLAPAGGHDLDAPVLAHELVRGATDALALGGVVDQTQQR